MADPVYTPHHITATAADTVGNQGLGRYFLVPGSSGRAKKISELLTDVQVRESDRGHNVYIGKLGDIDVGVCSTGMGAPSTDIIITELIRLGAKRFLRIGTAGSVQPKVVVEGSLAIATGSVRDEGTTRHYAPLEFPAQASPLMVQAAINASFELGLQERTFRGIFHSKDSLMAREFKEGPKNEENSRYMELMENMGVICSEMESATVFMLALVHSGSCASLGNPSGPHANEIMAGCVVAVIGGDNPFGDPEIGSKAGEESVQLGLETLRQLYKLEVAQRGQSSMN